MKKLSQANMLIFITIATFFIGSLFLGVAVIMTEMFGIHIFSESIYPIMFISNILLVLPALIYIPIKRFSIVEIGRFKRTKPVNFVMAFLVLLCSYPVVISLNMISMMFVENAVSDTMNGLFADGNLGLAILVIAVFPAIIEEFLFRGVLYNTYSKKYPVAGLIISSVFFALMHGNFNQIPYALFLGIVFVFMLEATDSIWITMFMHFMLNGSNAVIAYFTTDLSEVEMTGTMMLGEELIASGGSSALVMIIAMGIVMAVCFGFAVFGLIQATFVINHKTIKECFSKKVYSDDPEKCFDFWQLGFVIFAVIQIIIDMLT